MNTQLFQGDCLQVMRDIPDNSVDSIVTDPPYGLSFMGKKWDYDVPSVEIWAEALRLLKPGGHLLSFAGSRTYHRMTVNIEDAGFEIRDQIMWVYGSGFPKSHNVGNAIDKNFGCGNRGHAISSGSKIHPTTGMPRANGEQLPKYEGRTSEGKKWQGWGTALKPAHEPICVARKLLVDTVAANVLEWGTGGLNVDGCRVGVRLENESGWSKTGSKASPNRSMSGANYERDAKDECGIGRWPANFIHDGIETEWARYFYCAKASKRDRDEGCEGLEVKQSTGGGGVGDYLSDVDSASGKFGSEKAPARNRHPTVKPTDLMRYLVRLVTPPSGVVLDPFMGSGSTGKAAILEGFGFIGIEMSDEYLQIAKARIEKAKGNQ